MTLSGCWRARNEAYGNALSPSLATFDPFCFLSWSQVVSGSLGARLLGSFNLEKLLVS